jgi:ectoine hydroxylase-related dioxygenase (phytanoyl-CoA dioxygenase family)
VVKICKWDFRFCYILPFLKKTSVQPDPYAPRIFLSNVMNDQSNKRNFKRFYDKTVVPDAPIDVDTQPFRHKDFPDSGPHPWLDRPDAKEQIEARLHAQELTEEEADLCRKWERDGYIILKGFFSHEQLDATWAEYEAEIASGNVQPPNEPLFEGDTLPGRVLNTHFKVGKVKEMLFDDRMSGIVSLLLGTRALPFQTISGHKSSEQLQHSDSIHMSTYPTGYLVANWIAFEDIHPDSGPLVYHPGSHKLPYLMSDELDIPFDVGYKAYKSKYEPAVQDLVAKHSLDAHYFLPQKGDVLLWHANLLHGGSKMRDPARVSRKALVCHFFAEGCTCYHDLIGMPASVMNLPFDAPGYLKANPDVAQSEWDPGHHYFTTGRFEGRVPGEFDSESYLKAHPDVAAAGIDAYTHYRLHGYKEGRSLK